MVKPSEPVVVRSVKTRDVRLSRLQTHKAFFFCQHFYRKLLPFIYPSILLEFPINDIQYVLCCYRCNPSKLGKERGYISQRMQTLLVSKSLRPRYTIQKELTASSRLCKKIFILFTPTCENHYVSTLHESLLMPI